MLLKDSMYGFYMLFQKDALTKRKVETVMKWDSCNQRESQKAQLSLTICQIPEQTTHARTTKTTVIGLQ